MKHEECFQLGIILKKVGHDGRVSAQLDTDNPRDYINMESVFLEIHGKLVPFFIEQFKVLNDNSAHIKFEDISTTDDAESLVGSKLMLPLEALPPLEGNKFYYHEVIGFEIINDTDMSSAGVIKSIFENGPNDLFITSLNDEDVYIPIADDWIIEVNRDDQKIIMDLPDGLLNVNNKVSKPEDSQE